MEDYDTFVQHCISLRKREEEDKKDLSSSSHIRFYGRPILPPLLSGEQREEMRRYRDAAQKAAVCRKKKDDARMAYVQTILRSVQLRKTPTLEELLQESEIDPKFSHLHKTEDGSVSQRSHFMETNSSFLSFPTPNSEEKDVVPLPPFTSTTYSAFLTSNVTPQEERCLMDPPFSQYRSQPSFFDGVSHQSSGYVTYQNVENTTSVSGEIDAGRESMGCFFLHSNSNTIAKMPDIISYPPIDGEELERSGLESSFCKDFEDIQDVCCATLQEDSVMCQNVEGGKSESSRENSTEGEANLSVATISNRNVKDSGKMGGQVPTSEYTDNLQPSQTCRAPLYPTTELHIQHDHTDSEEGGKEEPPEEPYRLSLQALLKKSQEYRRRQRMLRNQAKNSKIQERAQEQPRARVEEASLSDKENDEFPHKGRLKAEEKKSKDRRGALIQSEETLPKKSWEHDRRIESELFEEQIDYKTASTTSTEDHYTKEMIGVEEEILNNKLDISQELPTGSKQISVSPVQETICFTPSPSTFHKGGGTYKNIPAPNFCRSPSRCKNKSSAQAEEADPGLGSLNVVNDEPQHNHTKVSSALNNRNKKDLPCGSLKSSQHIDQLESNLSGLKIIISDLASTLTENFRNQSLTESEHTHSDNEGGKDAEQDQSEQLRRQSFDSVLEDTGSIQCGVSNKDDDPVISEERGTEEVNLSELRLFKTLALERGKEKGSWKDELTKSYGHHGGTRKQQPTAKCLLSVTQRQRIPDMFRNVASEPSACKTLVLTDTSNHPVEKRNEAAEDGHNSTRLPSFNESYDVDTPSGLWLREGLDSNLGAGGHLIEEKHLTPESEGEGQGGVSKVKRRLLMHMTEETEERSSDVIKGAGSELRPNSSTPRAAVHWSEGHSGLKDRQEQLKQAHAAQVKALQDEHRRQQEELLQPSSTLSERCRPLLLAAVKGFLTRRLMKTERVAQLARTIRDTKQLLQALQQQQSPGRGDFSKRQDLLLQHRAALQLRAARYEVNDIFFSLSARERMQLISSDRELVRERELRQQSGHLGHPRGKSSLSAATQKSLERKKEIMMQKKAAERNRGVVARTRRITGPCAEQPVETKRGQFKANPQRVPKTYSSRPR
ncbi:uncharacterized protein si:ch73-100l22.3 isoform X2 [Cheilinus undulatus]|uniref:uncharacterized protein si:ch73-100l22.3 isoform X2 n=1 Tax=Cheilinus undulatus TaxID=241271 RepID=UPI001BD69A65|nr:uncharacterized protein si:ch73-100l22.3 isoform X2 [Cheilinus undulatus]